MNMILTAVLHQHVSHYIVGVGAGKRVGQRKRPALVGAIRRILIIFVGNAHMERKRQGRYLIRVQFPTGRVGQKYNCDSDVCQITFPCALRPITQVVDLIHLGIG